MLIYVIWTRWLYTDDKNQMADQPYSRISIAIRLKKIKAWLISSHLPWLGLLSYPWSEQPWILWLAWSGTEQLGTVSLMSPSLTHTVWFVLAATRHPSSTKWWLPNPRALSLKSNPSPQINPLPESAASRHLSRVCGQGRDESRGEEWALGKK